MTRPTTMINILGEDTLPDGILKEPSCHIHWYGKEKRPGRKMGHINVSAKNEQELSECLLTVSRILDESKFPAVTKACK